MKPLTLYLLLILCAKISVAQSYSENDSLYLKALEKYSNEVDSFYIKYSENKEQLAILYIDQTNLIKGIPGNIGGREVVIINNENLKEIYKKNNWKLIQTKIFPIEVKNGQIEITIIPYHGEMDKKGNLNLALIDWTNVFFEYDCEKKKWIYYKTENGGI